MTLPDKPPHVIHWGTKLEPDMLQAIGHLAVITSGIEELLHQIYWKHAGLNERSGPIITHNHNPKLLSEDIIKFVQLMPAKAHILADLKVLFAEFETINTKRNHCLHWIWDTGEEEREESSGIVLSAGPVPKVLPYRVKRPIYRRPSEVHSESFSVEDIKALCDDSGWLASRLLSHTFEEKVLKAIRHETDQIGALHGGPGATLSFGDLFYPAPWLDKPVPPKSKPSVPPETQK